MSIIKYCHMLLGKIYNFPLDLHRRSLTGAVKIYNHFKSKGFCENFDRLCKSLYFEKLNSSYFQKFLRRKYSDFLHLRMSKAFFKGNWKKKKTNIIFVVNHYFNVSYFNRTKVLRPRNIWFGPIRESLFLHKSVSSCHSRKSLQEFDELFCPRKSQLLK